MGAEAMITPEVREFLLEGTRTGKLATVRKDGRPHVAPIWFTLDGDEIIFHTWHTTVKAANIRRDPRVCLCVDEETPLYSYVQVEGLATLYEEPDMNVSLKWATIIGGRYMGAEKASEYGKRNSVPGEMLVRLRPTKVIYKKDIAGYG